MSAIEQLPPPAAATPLAIERRSAPRHRLRDTLPVLIGRGEGTLVDISATGARVRHETPVRLGTHVRLSFLWQRRRFAATAVVHSSRVVALGDASAAGATLFETRLELVGLTTESADVLTELVRSLNSEDLRRWVANLHGWTSGDQPAGSVAAFIRCRRFLHRWDRKWTREPAQPENGFTVPATLDERELALLCRMWDGSDEEGRALLRETARASVECSL